MITPSARVELGRLADDIEKTFRDAGIRARSRKVGNVVVHEFLVPLRPRPLLVSARVALPKDEIGRGKVGKKIAKKTVKIAKKVAHSKALKTLAKVIGPIAAVVPGLQPLAAGMAAAKAAAMIARAAKKGSKKAKAIVEKVAKGGRIRIATKVAQKLHIAKHAPHLLAPTTSHVGPTLYLVSDARGMQSRVTL